MIQLVLCCCFGFFYIRSMQVSARLKISKEWIMPTVSDFDAARGHDRHTLL